MDKERRVECCSVMRSTNDATCSNLDGPRDYHTKLTKAKTDVRYHLHVESKQTVQINPCIKQNQTHRPRKQIYGYQRGRQVRDKLGV